MPQKKKKENLQILLNKLSQKIQKWQKYITAVHKFRDIILYMLYTLWVLHAFAFSCTTYFSGLRKTEPELLTH